MEAVIVDLGELELICRPCIKCEMAEKIIKKALFELSVRYKVQYKYKIKRTSDLTKGIHFSANISKTPFIVADNQLIFAGRLNDITAIKTAFLDFIRNRGTLH